MGGVAIAAEVLGATGFTGAFQNISDPLKRLTGYTVNENFPNNLPDPGTLVNLATRNLIKGDEFYQLMKKYGYDESWSWVFLRSNQTFLSAYEYISLYRRGVIDEDYLKFILTQIGVAEDQQGYLIKSTEYFPTPADLVRFAVREVYSPEIRRKFGMDNEISSFFLRESAKTGMTEEQARNYWAAHWELPSVYQAFEMFHRDIINADELDMLLTAQDVMPWWKERLKGISYNVITRVDIRRMWAFGVITDFDELVTHYRHAGYSPEDAKALADFTVKYESDEMAGLTRATVISSYKKGIITKEQLQEFFSGFGYTERVQAFWIDTADFERANELIEKEKDSIVNRFLLGDISLDEVKQELLTKDLPANYIDAILNDIKLQTTSKLKIPGKEDLLNWLDKSIITDRYFYESMLLLGYRKSDIQHYLEYNYIDKLESERKFLKIEVYVSWVISDIMSVESFVNTAMDMRLSKDDIYKFLAQIVEQKPELNYIDQRYIIELESLHEKEIKNEAIKQAESVSAKYTESIDYGEP